MSEFPEVIEARRALAALYAEVPELVAQDVNRKVQAAFVALTRPPLPSTAPVVVLDEYEVVDRHGATTDGDRYSREEAESTVEAYDTSFPSDAPHRVMRVALVEVPDAES